MGACWECGAGPPLHNHHVVPRSRGGTKTVPLCEPCHGKAHGRRMNTSELTKDGLAKAKARGVKMGATAYGETPEERETIALVVALYAEGLTLQKVCDQLTELGRMNRMGRPFQVSTIHSILKQAQAPKRARVCKEAKAPKEATAPDEVEAPKAHTQPAWRGHLRQLQLQQQWNRMARERQH